MRTRFFGRFWRKKVPGTPVFLYNTLGRAKQEFKALSHDGTVRMYNCGPTVYDVQHIGNLSMFVFADVLRRTLEYNGLAVKQVINITDVGHLTSDADDGEDKMTKGLRRAKKKLTLENMRELGEHYTQIFFEDLRKLNIDKSKIVFPRASDHIAAQIAMIRTLQEKGYAYTGHDGVYFDTSRFPAYGMLGGINIEGQKEGARVAVNSEKHHSSDFVLWKLDPKIGWDSPWGKGFPGWHIECSAMIRATLGEQIDIHTGGIEHIGVHHNNEIAQSEAATGKNPLSRFWMHRAHVQLEGTKLAKSKGNVVYLSEIIERGFNPLALRYLFLGAHYRTPSNFTWEALEAAQNTLFRLYYELAGFLQDSAQGNASQYLERFLERINDDVDTPGALAVMWEMIKDASVSADSKIETLKQFDKVLGLKLAEHIDAEYRIPPEVERLAQERQAARSTQDWERADILRKEIESVGYTVKDTESGPLIQQKRPTPQQRN